MGVSGYVHEVFASFQGEGLHVGRRHVFVRMGGCSLRCRFCDTPNALVRAATGTIVLPDGTRSGFANPVDDSWVADRVDELDPDSGSWVALTGGEPLEQPAFLESLVDRLRRPIYLETAGVHAESMLRLSTRIDFISFDLKLDSVAREGNRQEAHRAFLEASRGVPRMAKIVVNAEADLSEIAEYARILVEEDPSIPVVLQPETPRQGGSPRVPRAILDGAYAVLAKWMREVRVIPQMHRFLDIP